MGCWEVGGGGAGGVKREGGLAYCVIAAQACMPFSICEPYSSRKGRRGGGEGRGGGGMPYRQLLIEHLSS